MKVLELVSGLLDDEKTYNKNFGDRLNEDFKSYSELI